MIGVQKIVVLDGQGESFYIGFREIHTRVQYEIGIRVDGSNERM